MTNDEELTKILKDVRSALEEERVGRRKLEQDVTELKKVLNPDFAVVEAPLAPAPTEEVKEVLDYVRGQKASDAEKLKRKKERYRLSTPAEAEKEADELWTKMLEDAEQEED